MPKTIDSLDKNTIAQYFLEAKEYCEAISHEKLTALFKDDKLQEDLLIVFPKLHQPILAAKSPQATDIQKATSAIFCAAIYARMLWSFNPHFYDSLVSLIESIHNENLAEDKEKMIFYGQKENNGPCTSTIMGTDHPLITYIKYPLSPMEAERLLSYLVTIITPLFMCDDIHLDNIGITANAAKLLGQIRCHTLSIKYNPLGDDGIKTLLEQNIHYDAINAEYCDIRDAGAQVIAASSLRSVNLAYNKISDQGAIALARNISIHNLDISNNPIKDEGIIALAKKANLRELCLGDLALSEEALKAIASHSTLTSLSIGAMYFDMEAHYNLRSCSDSNEKEQMEFELYKISRKGITIFNELLKQNYTLLKIKISRESRYIARDFKFAEILKRNNTIHLMETRDAISDALEKATNCKTLEEAQNTLNSIKNAIEKITSSLNALSSEANNLTNAIKNELEDKLKQCNLAKLQTIHHYFDKIYMHSDQANSPISLLMECCKIIMSDDGKFHIDFSDNAFNKRFDLILKRTLGLEFDNNKNSFSNPLVELNHSDRLLLLSQAVGNWHYPAEDHVYYLLLLLNIGEQIKKTIDLKEMDAYLNKLNSLPISNKPFREMLTLTASLELQHPDLISRLRNSLMNMDLLDLNLNNLKLTDDAFSKILGIVSKFPNYKRAKVRVFEISQENNKEITNYQSDFYSRQNTLRLNGSELSSKTIDILSKITIFSIVTLENNQLTDSDIEVLASNPYLRSLELANNLITEKGAEKLAQFLHLRQLDLSSNPVQLDLALSHLKNSHLTEVIVDPSLTSNNVALFPSMLANHFAIHIKDLKELSHEIWQRREQLHCTLEEYTPSDDEILLDKIHLLLKKNQNMALGISIDMAKEALSIENVALYSIDELTIIHQRLSTVRAQFSDPLQNNQEIANTIKDLLSKADKDNIEKIEHQYLSTGLELLSDSMENNKKNNEKIKNILLEWHQKIVAQINLLAKKPPSTNSNTFGTLFNAPKTDGHLLPNKTTLGFSRME